MCMLACAGDRLSAAGCSWRACFLFCSVNGHFLNGYCYIIILFWKKEDLKIVKMLNKRTNVRVCSAPGLLG